MQTRLNKSSLFIISIFLVVSIIFTVSLPNRVLHGDDAWFAEQSYWLANEGVVRSELFRGILDYETRMSVYHKLHIWQGAIIASLPDWSIYNFKFVSFIYLCVMIAGIWALIRKFGYSDQKNIIFILMILLVANGYLVEYSFVYRPEISMSALGVWAFYHLIKFNDNKRKRHVLIAAFLSGLIVLFHLNGIIFVIAGMSLLLFSRNFIATIYFLAASFLVCALYFIDIVYFDDFSRFVNQFTHDPALLDKDKSIIGVISTFLSEPDRYFSHTREGSYSLLMLFIILIARRNIWSNTYLKYTAIYLAILSITMAFIAAGKKPYYLILTMPFFFILAASQFNWILNAGKTQSRTLITLCFLYLIFNEGFIVKYLILEKNHLPQTHANVIKTFNIPEHSKIVAPIGFIFNELPGFQIQEIASYEVQARLQHEDPSQIDYGTYADKYDRYYIILTKDFVTNRNITNKRISGFDFLGQEDKFLVYKKHRIN